MSGGDTRDDDVRQRAVAMFGELLLIGGGSGRQVENVVTKVRDLILGNKNVSLVKRSFYTDERLQVRFSPCSLACQP